MRPFLSARGLALLVLLASCGGRQSVRPAVVSELRLGTLLVRPDGKLGSELLEQSRVVVDAANGLFECSSNRGAGGGPRSGTLEREDR